MYEMTELETGKSYACRFRVNTVLDADGNPASPLTGTNPDRAGEYEGLGVIKKRDVEQRLVELEDTTSRLSFVVSWDDCWDIDDVEWTEALD
jgi:hypothetical protein